MQFDPKIIQEETTERRGARKVAKGGNSLKKKSLESLKFPPVRISDDSRRMVLVLNVVGLLCDIEPLHDNWEWRLEDTIDYEREFKVKIKRVACGVFLTMLHSRFDVEIWAPIGEGLLEEVAKFLVVGTSIKWCFFVGEGNWWSIAWSVPSPSSRLRLHCNI